MDKQDERVCDILDSNKVPDVSDKYVKKYLDYLESNIKFPIIVKGLESPNMGKYPFVSS